MVHAVVSRKRPLRRHGQGSARLNLGRLCGGRFWTCARLPGRVADEPYDTSGAALRHGSDVARVVVALMAAGDRLAAARTAEWRDVPRRPRLAVRHTRDHGTLRRRPPARASLRAVYVPRDHGRARGTRSGVRRRRASARRKSPCGDPTRHADPRPRHHLCARDRLRRVGERLRGRVDPCLQLALPARDLPALRRHQRLSTELFGRSGSRMAPRRVGSGATHLAGESAPREVVSGSFGADSNGRAPRTDRQGQSNSRLASSPCSTSSPLACRALVP